MLQGSFHVALQATNKVLSGSTPATVAPSTPFYDLLAVASVVRGASLVKQTGDCKRLRLQKAIESCKKKNSFCHRLINQPRETGLKVCKGLWEE